MSLRDIEYVVQFWNSSASVPAISADSSNSDSSAESDPPKKAKNGTPLSGWSHEITYPRANIALNNPNPFFILRSLTARATAWMSRNGPRTIAEKPPVIKSTCFVLSLPFSLFLVLIFFWNVGDGRKTEQWQKENRLVLVRLLAVDISCYLACFLREWCSWISMLTLSFFFKNLIIVRVNGCAKHWLCGNKDSRKSLLYVLRTSTPFVFEILLLLFTSQDVFFLEGGGGTCKWESRIFVGLLDHNVWTAKENVSLIITMSLSFYALPYKKKKTKPEQNTKESKKKMNQNKKVNKKTLQKKKKKYMMQPAVKAALPIRLHASDGRAIPRSAAWASVMKFERSAEVLLKML